jgi:hypothetical protein
MQQLWVYRLVEVCILVKENNIMRKISFTILFVWVALQQICAQNFDDKLVSFQEMVLPRYGIYFSKAGLTGNSQLLLLATEQYRSLSINFKKTMMDTLVGNWQESLVLVKYDTKSELWGWNSETGKALQIDLWDLNAQNIIKSSSSAPVVTKTGLHPWFVYVGGQGVLDSDHNLNVALNTRVGFFLLLNRWDLAWTFSLGVLGNVDSTASSNSQLGTGLMSKFYFPIKKLKLSPNVGFDVQGVTYINPEGGSSTATNRALLAGVSWYVGHGSFDLGFRISKEFSATIGYTIMPKFGKSKTK